MKTTLFFALLAALLLALALPLSAKGPTARITISGGELPGSIEVTEPRILAASNVWNGGFLDSARGTLKQPPPGLRRYEVSFYVNLGDAGVPKMYVVYYSPDPSTGHGYIYLPARGETWYTLNTGTILRDGRDGRWNYASPAWEALLKPVIAGAEAAAQQPRR